MNILIVEDDQVLRKALHQNFSNENNYVLVAADGQQALDIVHDNRNIDLIICDIMMPFISGPTFILMLKQYFGTKVPAIIVMSTIKEGDAFLNKIEVRYDHFISKPIDFKLLNEITDNLVKK